jgi:hypothetical protein
MNTVLSSFIIAIGGAIAIKTNEFLAARLPIWLSVLMAAALSATFVFAANTTFGWLRGHIAAFRRLVDPRAQFEGQWALRVDREDRPYSFAEIGFNRVSRDYQYTGVAFGKSGESLADWTASNMTFDLANNVINFVATVTVQDRSEDRQAHPTWGTLRFQRDPSSGELTTCHGTIVDLGTIVRKLEFLMEKISKEEIEETMGKKKVRTERDKARLVQAHFAG